jgi:hypothetical protein
MVVSSVVKADGAIEDPVVCQRGDAIQWDVEAAYDTRIVVHTKIGAVFGFVSDAVPLLMSDIEGFRSLKVYWHRVEGRVCLEDFEYLRNSYPSSKVFTHLF